MSMSDPIADMLTRIRNAYQAAHKELEMPSSRIKSEIARILKEEGYIETYEVVNKRQKPVLKIGLRYEANQRQAIRGIKRISKPGLRVYVKKDKIPKVLGGLGIAIISTSRGLMTNNKAAKEGVGGEVICYVW
jgi:small subunit ribosomal protein S8